jgi:ribosomal subunit interface protein
LKLTVTGRHMAIAETNRQLIRRKLRRLERVLNDSAVSAQCVVARERELHVCEVTVHARGDHTLHGAARDPRLPAAIGAAVDKVSKQAQRLVDRWKTRRKVGG